MHRNQLLMSTSLVAALLIGCTGSDTLPAEVPEGAQPVTIRPLHPGEVFSGFDRYARLVIRDDATWAGMWQQMMRGSEPVPDLPEVDFKSDLVLLAAMGPRQTTGFSIEIEEVQIKDGDGWVTVVERFPGPDCVTFDAITRPVHAVAVPRHPGQTIFLLRTETVDCE
jgi:hypothetical protein